MLDATKADTIARLNDEFRTFTHGATPGSYFMTPGVTERGEGFISAVLEAVIGYDTFTPESDPRGERNFGVIDLTYLDQPPVKLFWKIDYYADAEKLAGSEEPSDPDQCFRVMTIMTASEY